MKVGDVEFDEFGAKVKLTSGKVGQRTIRVVACIPRLKEWIDKKHPNPKKSNFLWVSLSNKR